MTYTQCLLRRGSWRQVAWIPTILATVGADLEIGGEQDWQVAAVYQTVDKIPYARGDCRAHRRATGDNERKLPE